MFTLPTGDGSYLLATGPKKHEVQQAFASATDADGFTADLVSRKKQVLPTIIGSISQKK